MGYEVLDADGVASRVSNSPYPSPEVVPLDDLPAPPSAPEASRRRTPRPLLTRLRNAPARRTWALVAAAALLGVAVGWWWAQRRQEQLRRVQAQTVVQAFASADGVDPSVVTGQGRFADVTARLVNLGPLPITVNVSSGGRLPRPGSPTVSMVSGLPEVGSGEESLARIRVALDCASNQPLSPTLPVTTADGRTHQLPVRAGLGSGTQIIPADLCSMGMGQQVLDVSLSGTLARPALVLRNTSERQLVVSLDSGSPLTQAASTFLSLTTVPRLPVAVRAHGTITMQLRLTVTRCRQTASDLASVGQYGYLGLQGESSSGPLTDGTANAGVDLSPLIGAAMARACQQPAR